MKLDQFIKTVKKGKWPREVKEIQHDFIESGYEKYLFRNSMEVFDAWERTDIIVEVKKSQIILLSDRLWEVATTESYRYKRVSDDRVKAERQQPAGVNDSLSSPFQNSEDHFSEVLKRS